MNSPSVAERTNGKAVLSEPIIIDLGKISKKKVKQLKKGEGLYLKEVQPTIAEVAAELGDKAAGKEIIPVLVLYKQKPKKGKFPILNLLP